MPIKTVELKAKLRALGDLVLGPRDVIGIDIGSYALKVVHIKEEAGKLWLKSWGSTPIVSKSDAEPGPDERKIAVARALRGLLNERGIKIKEAATAVSGNSVIVRYVKFPLLTKAELAASLAAEAEPIIPFDINEVQLSFHILAEIMEEGQKKMETVLVAAKKELVGQRLDILEAAGLSPTIIDVDSFALENVQEISSGGKGGLAVLFLNIGHGVTNLSIIENGVTRVVRDVFISGQTATKAVAKAFQCDLAKAEELKQQHGIIIDPAEKEKALAEGGRDALGVSQACAQFARDLVSEVHRSVDFYLSQGPDRSIGRIVISGGSAGMRNLSKHLAQELKVPVEVCNPFASLSGAEGVPEAEKPAYAVAVGLALRRNKDWT